MEVAGVPSTYGRMKFIASHCKQTERFCGHVQGVSFV